MNSPIETESGPPPSGLGHTSLGDWYDQPLFPPGHGRLEGTLLPCRWRP